MGINDLADSYYQEWTYEDRKELEFTCQSGFLLSVVVVQWVAAVQARSRKLSILQRPFNNHCLTFALVFDTVLAARPRLLHRAAKLRGAAEGHLQEAPRGLGGHRDQILDAEMQTLCIYSVDIFRHSV